MVCIAILLVFLEGNSILMYACLIVAKRADQDNKIYRPQIRLHRDKPEDRIIIEKIENRDQLLHKTVNDYIKHAVYAFEDKKIPLPEEQNQMETELKGLFDTHKF